jgi:MFS family permease
VGEGAFVSMAPPFIIMLAPPEKKTLFIAIFYAAMPVGTAIGFVYGQIVAEALGAWFWPFVFEGAAMCVLLVLAVIMYKDPAFLIRKNPT